MYNYLAMYSYVCIYITNLYNKEKKKKKQAVCYIHQGGFCFFVLLPRVFQGCTSAWATYDGLSSSSIECSRHSEQWSTTHCHLTSFLRFPSPSVKTQHTVKRRCQIDCPLRFLKAVLG